jgi:hypothetical protein
MTEAEFERAEEIRRFAEQKVNAVKGKILDVSPQKEGLSESQQVASEVYGLVKPLVEMKRRQAIAEQELQVDIASLTNSLSLVTEQLQRATAKMNELIQSRSINAEKENRVLDSLLAVL